MSRKLTSQELKDEGFTPIQSKPENLGQRLAALWAEYKWLYIFLVLFAAAAAFGIYSCFGNHPPDLTVCVISHDSVISDEVCDRLTEEITEFAFDVNGDGAVKLSATAAYSGDDWQGDAAKTAARQVYDSLVTGGRGFAVICDSATKQTLIESGMCADMTEYSTQIPDQPASVALWDVYVFDDDRELYQIFRDYHVILLKSADNGADRTPAVKREIESAKLFFEETLINWQPAEQAQ